MKTSDLLLSSLHITEDDYIFRGTFILTCKDKSMSVDMSDLQNEDKISDLKAFFNLEEKNEDIVRLLMNMVHEKSSISSRTTES